MPTFKAFATVVIPKSRQIGKGHNFKLKLKSFLSDESIKLLTFLQYFFQMQRPGLVSINRERKPKMVPHKGVPSNVDAIFGNKRAPM